MFSFLCGVYNGHLFRKHQKRVKKQFGENAEVAQDALFSEQTRLGGYNIIGKNANIIDSDIGQLTYIGENSRLFQCKIGKYCSISWNVDILAGEHPLTAVSTHPVFYSNRNFAGLSFNNKTDFEELKYAKEHFLIEIGNDVLISPHVKIASGLKINDGAVIKAGAVVVSDVPAYAIVGGVPAKVIAYRFKQEDIDFLQSFKWWDKGIDWCRENANVFDNIERLREKAYIKEKANV